MQSFAALPNVPLQPGAEVTACFLALRITDFHAAARYVQQLPYGRTSDRANCRLVLSEGRGTCSAKHALLAQLAREQGVDIALTIGMYQMTERNTPGVGSVLEHYNLPSIPEAHCYLVHQERRIDVTRNLDEREFEPIATFLIEEEITTEQIGEYKRRRHQAFMRQWLHRRALLDFNLDQLWRIREQRIAALGRI